MFTTFRNAWKVPELRNKILYTLLIIFIFRLGCHIPVPFLDASVMASDISGSGSFLSYMDILSGGALSKGTIFALSIQPYINASIIVQLLTYALPPLENLQKEGEEGRKKLDTITMYVSLAIALVMSYAYYITQRNSGAVRYTVAANGASGVLAAIVIVAAFTAGAGVVVWLGNCINDKGIGNGISMILFAGIVSRGPASVLRMFELAKDDKKYYLIVPIVLIVFVLMIAFIVFMNESERRIPIQYAKRVVGRKQYGGQSTHIPIKIAMSGVMPIIFAMAIMSLPATLEMFIPVNPDPVTFWQKFYKGFVNFFSYRSGWYAIIYFILIIAFNYFYVAMQYNPIEIANNLRQSNGGIPGIRPGKPTSDYIQKVLSKITLVGAFFLGVIAIFPILSNMAMPDLNIAMGGTSILIVVSVVLETSRTLESQMMMRHHKGFLE